MDNSLNLFAKRLTEVLQTTEWTQQKLADKLGTTQQAVSKWARGDREPNLDMFMRICFHLGETADYMLGLGERDIENYEANMKRFLDNEKLMQEELDELELKREKEIEDMRGF